MYININEASSNVLQQLSGIGPARAAAIMKRREVKRFRYTSDIVNIPGISNEMYQSWKERLFVVDVKKGSTFFRNLCQQVQHGHGISYKCENSFNWIFLITEGIYLGKWSLGKKTAFSPYLVGTNGLNSGGGNFVWTGAPYGRDENSELYDNKEHYWREISKHRRQEAAQILEYKTWKSGMRCTRNYPSSRRLLFQVREQLAKIWVNSGAKTNSEHYVWCLTGDEGLASWRKKNSHQKMAIQSLLASSLFTKLPLKRKPVVLRRFLLEKSKAAWRGSFRVHPTLINQLVKAAHERDTVWHLLEREDLSGMGAYTDLKAILWLKRPRLTSHPGFIRSHDEIGENAELQFGKQLKSVLRSWYARNPGHFDLLQGTIMECERALDLDSSLRPHWLRTQNTEEHAFVPGPILEEVMNFENMNPDQVKRFHDVVIPALTAEARARRAQEEAEIRRAEVMRSMEFQARVEKFSQVNQAWNLLREHDPRDTWDQTVDNMHVEGLKLLQTKRDYEEEGLLMSHCVSSYFLTATWERSSREVEDILSWQNPLTWNDPSDKLIELSKKILSGEFMPDIRYTHVYHVEHKGELGTLAVYTNFDASEISFNQFMGPGNKRPSDCLVKYAKACFANKGWDGEILKAGYQG